MERGFGGQSVVAGVLKQNGGMDWIDLESQGRDKLKFRLHLRSSQGQSTVKTCATFKVKVKVKFKVKLHIESRSK